ncbi:MAG: hypothetical protein M1816_004574 [Peltula sp. TS41687]|nr:MAG: hypothetical protein M1816_004574 [Peltula sp. TS41687]
MKRPRVSETARLPTGQDIYDVPDTPQNQRHGNSQLPFDVRMAKGISSTKDVDTLEGNGERQAVMVESGASEKRRSKRRKGEVMDEPARRRVVISVPGPAIPVELVNTVARGESNSKPERIRSKNPSVANTRQTRSKATEPLVALPTPRKSKGRRRDRAQTPPSPRPRSPDEPDRSTRQGSQLLGDLSAHDDSVDFPAVEDVIAAGGRSAKGQAQQQSSVSEFEPSDEEPVEEDDDWCDQSPEEVIDEQDDGNGKANERDTRRSHARSSEPPRPSRRTDPSASRDGESRSYVGQIKEIKTALQSIGLQTREGSITKHQLYLKSRSVKDLVDLVRQTKDKYRDLAGVAPEELEASMDPLDDCLDTIEEKINGINEAEAKNDKQRSSTVVELYSHAIPALVRMLGVAISCCSEIEIQETAGLEHLVKIINHILLLYRKTSDWKKRPVSSLHIVKPIRQDVVPPLRKMRKELQKNIDKRKREASREALEAKTAIAARREEEENRRKRDLSEQVRRERHVLIKRQLQERGRRQLSTQSPPKQTERREKERRDRRQARRSKPDDNNGGESFERVQLFQSPGRSAKGAEEWAYSELKALVEGLECFTGPDRYQGIFDANCGPCQPLQSRNFDELVRKAKEIKADYIAQHEEHPNGRRPPDWLLSISD